MDIEEIKCPFCTQFYDENERIPILLPDCGHSFCLSCIHECFDLLRKEQEEQQQLINEEEQLTLLEEVEERLDGNNNTKIVNQQQKQEQILFKCPDDDVVCSIQKPELLPKNYALLKIVKKTKESLENQNKKIIRLNYQEEEKKFVVSKPVDNSLARYLSQTSKSDENQFQPQSQQQFRAQTQITNQRFPQSQGFQPSQYQTLQPQLLTQQPQPQPQLDLCRMHERPLEFICVDDKIRICAQCALFGPHKGHDVRMEEEVAKEIALKVEVIIEMYQAMEQSCHELNNQDNYEKQYNIYKQRQNEMRNVIQEQFKKWRQALRAVEMKAIDSLYANYQQFEEKFVQAKNHNAKMINEAQGWMDKAKQQLDEYTLKTSENPHFIPFDMVDNKNQSAADDILNQGEKLFDKFEKQKGYPSLNGLESSYRQVKVQFEPNFEKKLANIAKVYSTTQQNEFSGDFTTNSGSFLPTFSFHEEDERVKQETDDLNLSKISFNEPHSPINQSTTTQALDKEELKEADLKSDYNTSSVYQTNSTNKNNDSFNKMRRNSSKGPQLIPLGKKKMDLPSSFKNEVIDGELDLSNRSLSDMHSNELAKCIKTLSGPVKLLNLSRNRIQDDGVVHIIRALCDSSIECVTLESNKFTEKCVESIVGSLKTNKTLKVLDLSNNGIGSRLMKNKLKNALPQIEIIL